MASQSTQTAAFVSAIPLRPQSSSHKTPICQPCRYRTPPSAKMVTVSVPLVVELPPDTCHSYFSDLSKMPDWSKTLESVKRDPDDPLYSDWTFSWNGIRLSWRAVDEPSPERTIRWRAISGLNHTGEVTFTDAEESSTTLTMSVDYDVADLLAVVAESSIVSTFVESAIESDLSRFREYALREGRKERVAERESS